MNDVLWALSNVGRGSDDFLDLIEKTFIKHRKSLDSELIESARESFLRMNKGSEILYRILEDP